MKRYRHRDRVEGINRLFPPPMPPDRGEEEREALAASPVILSSYDDFVQQFGGGHGVRMNTDTRRPLWRRALAFLDWLLFHR
jgi:hypothetical protein